MTYGSRNQIKNKSAQYFGDEEYMKWQELVKNEAGVDVTIRCTPSRLSIRAASFTDYILAKSALRGRTSKEIYRDVIEPLRIPTDSEREKEPPTGNTREGQKSPAFDSTK